MYSIIKTGRKGAFMELKTTGFASPAQGYEEEGIDLNRLLIHNPPATYFGRLETNSMEALGLPQGSLLVVDRSINPAPNSFVLIRHEGEFLCRQLLKLEGKTVFSDGTTFILPTTDETEIIGTITASIKEYANANAH
jgi:DNA polymerase V